ncbi:type VII secretion protein EccE [Amycolatopsis albispora]|uniref:type VII secretion protein EccE n=1 Tax=Amycolatopsis albispora TaxID=1804986 RepID=UPI0026B97FD6
MSLTSPAPWQSRSAVPLPAGGRERGSIADPAVAPWILPIRARQVAVWEVAALGALAAYGFGDGFTALTITAIAVATLVILGTSVRFTGRHLAGWLWTWLTFRLRQHDDRRAGAGPLHSLVGEYPIRQHTDRAGNRLGIVGVGDGWTSVVRLTGGGLPAVGTLLDVLGATYRRADLPLDSAQLVVWTAPRPGRQPLRVCWLAVRYRPADAPIAALARGGGELGALRTTASAALGLAGALADVGYESTVLEAGELAEELRVALGAEPDFGGVQEVPEFTDGWRWWSAGTGDGRIRQSCFRPLSDRDLPKLVTGHVPTAAFTTVSYTLSRTAAGRERAEVTVRVGTRGAAEPPTGSPTLCGVPLVAVNGRHAEHVRRSLPLALP